MYKSNKNSLGNLLEVNNDLLESKGEIDKIQGKLASAYLNHDDFDIG